MAFCPILPKPFRMGSRGYQGFLTDVGNEEPRHQVELTGCWPGETSLEEPKVFFMGQTPVTRAQYRGLVNLSGIEPEPDKEDLAGKDDHPVVRVSWNHCQRLIAGLNGLDDLEASLIAAGIPKDYRFRFPTEAEWEYACRADTDTEYYTGDGEAALGKAGWYYGNAADDTHPVKQKAENDFDLSDMHGNVWEWCLDGYDSAAYAKRPAGKKDPFVRAETEDSRRVRRGGSWVDAPGDCRSAVRLRNHSGFRVGDLGFRLCLSSGPVDGVPGDEAEPVKGAERSGATDSATGAGGAEDDNSYQTSLTPPPPVRPSDI